MQHVVVPRGTYTREEVAKEIICGFKMTQWSPVTVIEPDGPVHPFEWDLLLDDLHKAGFRPKLIPGPPILCEGCIRS